jgi:hypothetical protein
LQPKKEEGGETMNRVRKGFVALAAALLLLGAGGKAQAVIGIPDDVPGSTLLYPFFKVDPTPTSISRLDTLIVVTNTEAGSNRSVHFTIWSVKSVHVIDFTVTLTPGDVFSCSLLDYLVNPSNVTNPCGGVLRPPASVVAQLLISGNILSGYITADVVSAPTGRFPGQLAYSSDLVDANILIGHMYLVNLPAGSAAGFNAVSIESTFDAFDNGGSLVGHGALSLDDDLQEGFYYQQCIDLNGAAACDEYDDRERIDGVSGEVAQTFDTSAEDLIPGGLAVDDSPLILQTRYFSASGLNGRTEIWLWKDRNTNVNTFINVFDEEERSLSLTLALPNEVNFLDALQVAPIGAPGGWFQIAFDCGTFGYCTYNGDSGDPGLDPTTDSVTPVQAVAYSLQFANSQDATLRWDAIFPAHRAYTDYNGALG